MAPTSPSRRILSPVGETRIELVTAFRAGAVALPRLDPKKLRFYLGTSLADLKIPYEATADAARIFSWAGAQLMALLIQRHKDALPPGDFDRIIVDDRFSGLPSLSDTLSPSTGNADVRSAAELAPRIHPALTGGVMSAWLGPGGGGRSMVALIIETLRAGVGEYVRARGAEETTTLASFMLSSLYPHLERGISSVTASASFDRFLRGAAACGAYLGWRIGIDRTLRDGGLPTDVALRMEAPVNPTVMLGGRAGVTASGATILGVDLQAGIPYFDDALSRMSGDTSPQTLQHQLATAVAADKEIARRVETAAAHSLLREHFLAAAKLTDQGQLPPDLSRTLRDLALYPHRVQPLLEDDKARKALWKQLQSVSTATSRAAEDFDALADALKSYTQKSPSSALGISKEEAYRVYARAAVALVCDHWIDRALGPWRRALDRRTGGEAQGGNEAEYQAGRLYRISTTPGPLLRQAVVTNVGHLFADVKDFTRRTTLVGQAQVGDLLRREFYLPVIEAAKRHYAGDGFAADAGGIKVNNLLGDAISLSGTITGLFALAVDVRRHLQAYERHLMRQISSESISRALEEIEQEYQAKLQVEPPHRHGELFAMKEAALARARGEGLEAGIFVSYGPAPIVITINDDLFGQSRVAIADRINESARGTARSGGARVSADAALAVERQRRGDSSLAHPWQVFVGAPLSLNVSADTERVVRSALAAKDVKTAKHALDGLVAIALEAAMRPDDEVAGDIYNNGVALSEEALFGFQQEIGNKRVFRGVEVHPATLNPAITSRFYFGERALKLIVAYSPDGRPQEMFRYCGRCAFKGFDRKGGIAIWELISETVAGQMIAQHHGAEWFRLVAPRRATG